MSSRKTKLILTYTSYGGLMLSIAMYILLNSYSSQHYGLGLRPLRGALSFGVLLTSLVLLANLAVAIKYMNPFRAASIMGIILSAILFVLWLIPLALS